MIETDCAWAYVLLLWVMYSVMDEMVAPDGILEKSKASRVLYPFPTYHVEVYWL